MKRSSKIAAIFAAVVMAATSVPTGAYAQVTQSVTAPQYASEKKDISECRISEIKDQVYTGKAIDLWAIGTEPDIVSKQKNFFGEFNYTLRINQDFTVTYKNNVKIGKATAVIKGIGDFSGQISVTFNIVPPAPTNVKATSKNGKVTITWDKVKSASSYIIYYSKNGGDFKKLATTSKNKYSTSKLNFKKDTYNFSVTAVKTVNKQKYVSSRSWSSPKIDHTGKSSFDSVTCNGTITGNGSSTKITIKGFDFSTYTKKASSQKPVAVMFGFASNGNSDFEEGQLWVLIDDRSIAKCFWISQYGEKVINYYNYSWDKNSKTLAVDLGDYYQNRDLVNDCKYLSIKAFKCTSMADSLYSLESSECYFNVNNRPKTYYGYTSQYPTAYADMKVTWN